MLGTRYEYDDGMGCVNSEQKLAATALLFLILLAVM